MAGSFSVKCNGTSLSRYQLDLIQSISVVQNINGSDTCTINFLDVGGTLTDDNTLPIGADLEVSMGLTEAVEKVFDGVVKGHSLKFSQKDTPTFTVTGQDKATRLQGDRTVKVHKNVTDSDIATKVARDHGLRAEVDSTSEVYDQVVQDNQTGHEFLKERAARLGFECFVQENTLYFRKPKIGDSATITLELRKDLTDVTVTSKAPDPKKSATVRGWDPKTGKAIVGHASQGDVPAEGGQIESGAKLAQKFDNPTLTVTRRPVQSQDEADKLAQAALNQHSSNSITLKATALGNPRLKPGISVKLEGLGERFSATYYLNSTVTHSFGAQGYTTVFQIEPKHATLTNLLKGPKSGMGQGHGLDSSVVVGVVSNNKDDQGLGRVKFKLPWLSDDEEFDWARVVTPNGGDSRGFYWLPEVNDEVLIAFEQGDVTGRAYVIGGLYSDQAKPPEPNSSAVDGSGKVVKRTIKSRSGHTITLDDTDGSEKITVVDKSGNNTITIDTSNNKITLNAQGDLELKAGGNVKVSGNAISVEAQGNCDIKANGNASVQAQADCEIKANANAKLSGSMTSVEAQGNLSVQASGPCAIKGAVVQLN